MGTNNVKALRLLGATRRKPFFECQVQEIATMYDPQHLKRTSNLFQKYDIQFKSEHVDSQLPVFAIWEHIVKLYKRDKDGRIRMLYKLNDIHLPSVAQFAIKVSWDAQVMSHNVAAGIYSLVSADKEQCLSFIHLS
jgi:hypothetical protein